MKSELLFECPRCRGPHFNVGIEGTLICTNYIPTFGAKELKYGCGWRSDKPQIQGWPKNLKRKQLEAELENRVKLIAELRRHRDTLLDILGRMKKKVYLMGRHD